MALPPPLTHLPIALHDRGFYEGFNRIVTVGAKTLVVLIILWAAVFPERAGALLSAVNAIVLANFGAWYVYVTAFFVLVCLALAIWPATAEDPARSAGRTARVLQFLLVLDDVRRRHRHRHADLLDRRADLPLLDQPRRHPRARGRQVGRDGALGLQVVVPALGPDALGHLRDHRPCLAFFSYSRGLPLTIRSGLTPIFGGALSGPIGHVVDIIAVIATVLGVAVTIGFGVSQFSSGLHALTGAEWMMFEGAPTNTIMIICLVVVMAASTLSAASGVGRGIKWLSNINMALTFFLLAFFLVFGATLFAFKALAFGLFDYLVALPGMMFTVWQDDGTEAGAALAGWQRAGRFLLGLVDCLRPVCRPVPRASLARATIREFVLGAMLVPSLMCFLWFVIVGGTAIDLELNGGANRAIMDAGLSSQLFAMLSVMLSPVVFQFMTVIVVILLLTYLVTSADSAILIINTINSGGDARQKGVTHILIGARADDRHRDVLAAGELAAIETAMIIEELPFSAIMALMAIALIKALVRDGIRAREAALAA